MILFIQTFYVFLKRLFNIQKDVKMIHNHLTTFRSVSILSWES